MGTSFLAGLFTALIAMLAKEVYQVSQIKRAYKSEIKDVYDFFRESAICSDRWIVSLNEANLTGKALDVRPHVREKFYLQIIASEFNKIFAVSPRVVRSNVPRIKAKIEVYNSEVERVNEKLVRLVDTPQSYGAVQNSLGRLFMLSSEIAELSFQARSLSKIRRSVGLVRNHSAFHDVQFQQPGIND